MFALPWSVEIRTAEGPIATIAIGNINTSEDALATVQAITALLSFPNETNARAWLLQRFSRQWLVPLQGLAQELPAAFWVDILDPSGHCCHTGLSPAAAFTDQVGLNVVRIPQIRNSTSTT